jgi:hypothetical protein
MTYSLGSIVMQVNASLAAWGRLRYANIQNSTVFGALDDLRRH